MKGLRLSGPSFQPRRSVTLPASGDGELPAPANEVARRHQDDQDGGGDDGEDDALPPAPGGVTATHVTHPPMLRVAPPGEAGAALPMCRDAMRAARALVKDRTRRLRCP